MQAFDGRIRRAEPSDAEALVAYLNKIGGESDNLTFGKDEFPINAEQERAFLEAAKAGNENIILIAEEAGRIIADGSIARGKRRFAHRAELGISVLKEAWGRGVGTALMQALIDAAKASGTELINLEVRADNSRAIRLYERFGFKRVGVSPAYMKIGGEYADVVLMYLDLRENRTVLTPRS